VKHLSKETGVVSVVFPRGESLRITRALVENRVGLYVPLLEFNPFLEAYFAEKALLTATNGMYFARSGVMPPTESTAAVSR
jgi:hypothetical protein